MNQITFEDFARFLKSVQNFDAPNCPVCGHAEFTLTTEFKQPDDKIASFGFVRTDAYGSAMYLQGHIPLLLTNCTKCGHVQAFMRHIVDAWLHANPEKEPHVE